MSMNRPQGVGLKKLIYIWIDNHNYNSVKVKINDIEHHIDHRHHKSTVLIFYMPSFLSLGLSETVV